jgi:hypothetical protein
MLDGTREKTGLKTGEGGPDTKEAEALADALNHLAERVQTLWFSFLTFMVYLAIAAGTKLNLPSLRRGVGTIRTAARFLLHFRRIDCAIEI